MSESASGGGAHHVGLMVCDLVKSRSFFVDILGFWQIGEAENCPAVLLTDGTAMITLWEAANATRAMVTDYELINGPPSDDAGSKVVNPRRDSWKPARDAIAKGHH